MPRSSLHPLSILLLLAASLSACQRGGGGAASGGAFQLREVYYGRLVEDAQGERVVSPLTTVETDPVTGLVIPGSLQPLASNIDMGELIALGLRPGYSARVVPRNALFVLEFSQPVDPASLRADEMDAAGNVIEPGSVQMRLASGEGIEVALSVHNGNEIWVNPVVGSSIGLPPSPISFDSSGQAQSSTTGHVRLRLPVQGLRRLSSSGGELLSPRSDGLGSLSQPITLNPGNALLDFINFFDVKPSNESFNGFLPDRTPPRIVRTHRVEGRLTSLAGDRSDFSSLKISGAKFSTLPHQRQGEWASSRLTLRPGQPDEEIHTILRNTVDTLFVLGTVTHPLADGEAYQLSRAEFFEPDPAHPIDAKLFDIENPENPRNAQLVNFLEVWEIDAEGKPFRGPIDMRVESLPPFSQISLRFNEPISASSINPWESVRVDRVPFTAGREVLSETRISANQRDVTLRPGRFDPTTGTTEIVGWGQGIQSLRFVVSTVPSVDFLTLHMPSEQVESFLNLGRRGVVDLGGRPLAFPASLFDPLDPVIEYSEPFQIDEAASTANPPPTIESWGVIVHRFQGKPTTGLDPDTGLAGVKFLDQPNYYTPIPDINLFVNGFLTGPPVTYVRKIHDDFFSPPDGNLTRFPNGLGAPLRSFRAAVGTSGQTYDGIRFQHVYRDVDASPGVQLAGTLMDLYQISWSPSGGNVTTDVYEDISIHAAHSTFRPITQQTGAGPSFPFYGMGVPFDFDTWLVSWGVGSGLSCTIETDKDAGPNHYSDLVTVVDPRRTYQVKQSNIYSVAGSQNSFLPWPAFDRPFQYNNGGAVEGYHEYRTEINDSIFAVAGLRPWTERRNASLSNAGGDSLLMEYRIRPQPTLVSGANGFNFAIGIQLSYFPFFRVFSVGGDLDGNGVINGNERLFPDALVNDVRARCASGPNQVAGGPTTFGDNSRYFAAFDYVKTTSVITSPFVKVEDTNNPDYFPAITFPPIELQPPATQAFIEYAGAKSVKGGGGTPYDPDITLAATLRFIGFRVTFIGSTQNLLTPNLDLIAIPYKRP